MAKDFVTNESLKNAGILYVFQVFKTAQLAQKICNPPQAVYSEIPQARQVPTLPYDLHKSAYNIIVSMEVLLCLDLPEEIRI